MKIKVYSLEKALNLTSKKLFDNINYSLLLRKIKTLIIINKSNSKFGKILNNIY